MEIAAVSFQHFADDGVDLSSLPRGPDPIGGKGKAPADCRVDGACGYGIHWRRTAHGYEEYGDGAEGADEDAVVGGADPAAKECEGGDERDVRGGSGVQEMEADGCEEKARESSGDAQNAAAEGGGEIGFEYDGDGHGQPVGAREAEGAAEGIADADADSHAEGVPEGC